MLMERNIGKILDEKIIKQKKQAFTVTANEVIGYSKKLLRVLWSLESTFLMS